MAIINVEDLLKKALIGKIFVDSEYSSKGDKEYYADCDSEYPPFDQKIVDVSVGYDGEDTIIYLKFLDEDGWSTYHEVYPGEDITVEDPKE